MAGPTCLVCGEPMKIAGKKKPYLGCPNGCTQTMVRKNVDQFEAKYGKDWRQGGTPASAPAPKGATPTPSTPTQQEPARAKAKTLDEEFRS